MLNANTQYYLYILYSKTIDRYYTGVSHDPETRLLYHNKSHKGWTLRGRPWELVFKIVFSSKSEAMKWEKWIKYQKNRRVIENIIDGTFKFGMDKKLR